MIRKLKVTPMGSPALQKPIKSGILEQEQNGVRMPSRAPMALPENPLIPLRIFLDLCGGK
jgi:hypothetical protein